MGNTKELTEEEIRLEWEEVRQWRIQKNTIVADIEEACKGLLNAISKANEYGFDVSLKTYYGSIIIDHHSNLDSILVNITGSVMTKRVTTKTVDTPETETTTK